DHDCSSEGFEGIRAQDILPLMLRHFHPARFFATGGFVDVIVDRGYGHGFDAENPEHLALVRCIAALNDVLLDAGLFKPPLMLASFTDGGGFRGTRERFYRNRRADNCLRQADPAWLSYFGEPG